MKLWVPKEFTAKESVFFMDATHRGDMYHFRAAMQISKYSVVLYGSTAKTGDLESYLQRSVLKNAKHIWVVPWNRDTIMSETKPTSFTGCKLDGNAATDGKVERLSLNTLGESSSTRVIHNKGTIPTEISSNMAILSQKSKDDLDKQFKKHFKETLKIDSGLPTILSLYRDTGTTEGGVYPELDTGDALKEINDLVKKIPAKDGKHLRTITCGNKVAVSGVPNIGEYWGAITVPTGETKRDAEAYFLEWAFKNNYYQMAIGFRSGVLDLFTFLGIPTVSIGLRHMIGEIRHELLAKEAFKRVNVQYDQPRHNTTAYIKPKDKADLPLMGSPFWLVAAPDDVKKRDAGNDTDKKKAQEKKPTSFTAFDKVVLEVGLKIASEKHLKWTKSTQSLKEGLRINPVKTETARYYYDSTLTDEKKRIQHFKDNQKLDTTDIDAREKKKDTLQEPDQLFKVYRIHSKRDWKDIHGILGDVEDEEDY